MPTPDTPRITDDEFRQLVMRATRHQDARMARYDQLHEEHLVHMARLGRQYEKLTEIALDLAQAQDRMEAMSRSQQRSQTLLHSLLEDVHVRMTQNEALAAKVQLTLDAVLAMLRHRNGHEEGDHNA